MTPPFCRAVKSGVVDIKADLDSMFVNLGIRPNPDASEGDFGLPMPHSFKIPEDMYEAPDKPPWMADRSDYSNGRAFKLDLFNDEAALKCFFDRAGYDQEKIDGEIDKIKKKYSNPQQEQEKIREYITALPELHKQIYRALRMIEYFRGAGNKANPKDTNDKGRADIITQYEIGQYSEALAKKLQKVYKWNKKQRDANYYKNGNLIIGYLHNILGMIHYLSTDPESVIRPEVTITEGDVLIIEPPEGGWPKDMNLIVDSGEQKGSQKIRIKDTSKPYEISDLEVGSYKILFISLSGDLVAKAKVTVEEKESVQPIKPDKPDLSPIDDDDSWTWGDILWPAIPALGIALLLLSRMEPFKSQINRFIDRFRHRNTEPPKKDKTDSEPKADPKKAADQKDKADSSERADSEPPRSDPPDLEDRKDSEKGSKTLVGLGPPDPAVLADDGKTAEEKALKARAERLGIGPEMRGELGYERLSRLVADGESPDLEARERFEIERALLSNIDDFDGLNDREKEGLRDALRQDHVWKSMMGEGREELREAEIKDIMDRESLLRKRIEALELQVRANRGMREKPWSRMRPQPRMSVRGK